MNPRNHTLRAASVGLACLAAHLPAQAEEYEVRLRVIALSGEQAPGSAGTWSYGGYSRPPVLNNNGEVVFVSRVADSAWPNGADEGMWIGDEGNLQLVLREGQSMPGFPESSRLPSPLTLANYMTLSDSGHTVVSAPLDDPNVFGGSADALWLVSRDQGPELLLREGWAGPGIPDDPFVSNTLTWTTSNPLIADDGTVTLLASYGAGFAVWQGAPGALNPAWIPEYTPAFGSGCVLGASNGVPAIANDQKIAYSASFGDPDDPTACGGGGLGLWREQGGIRELVATRETGGWTGIGNPHIAGDYYAFATRDGSIDAIQRVGPTGAIDAAVTVGDSAPGGEDMFFTSVLLDGMSEQGDVLFSAVAEGPSGATFGSWLATTTGIEPFALAEGSLPNGASMYGVIRERINTRGDGVYLATSTLGDTALYARNPRGEKTVIAYNGQEIEVRPGRTETIRLLDIAAKSVGNDGRGRSLNDHGQIVMWVSFGTRWHETGDAILIAELVCPGDADEDGAVTLNDLAVVLGDFGNSSPNSPGDTDGDGDTDLADLAKTLASFGQACR